MTWAKFGTEFRGQMQLAGLSDAAARTHFEALLWLYEVESADMRIPRRLVRTFAGTADPAAAAAELVAAGFWYEDAAGYEVQHHGDVYRQSLAAQLTKRGIERRRQQTKRTASRADVAQVAAPMPDGPTGADVGTNVGTNVGATQSVSHTGSPETEGQGQSDRSAVEPLPATQPVAGLLNGGTSSSTLPDRDTGSHQGDDRYAREICPACGELISRYKSGRIMPHRKRRGERCELSDKLATA